MKAQLIEAVTLLAIEDDAGDFGLIRAHARLSGLCHRDEVEPVLWAKSLASGILLARTRKPDLILLDLSLPDSAGIDTVTAIHTALPGVPIVVLTGHDDNALAIASLQAGAQDYLIKGHFDHDALGRSVRYALARAKLERRLQLSEVALNSVADGILITDNEAHIEWVNPAFTKLTGFTLADALGHTPGELLKSGLQNAGFYQEMWQCINSGQPWEADLINLRKDGAHYDEALHITPVLAADGSILHFVAIMQDITARKLADEHIRNLAFYDSLTQLPNRRLLSDRLNQAVAAGKRNGNYSALMFIDMDNFKPVNDTYGHTAGDLLLIEAARRLKACVRETDTVARFGGDEFIVLLGELTQNQSDSIRQAALISEKIRGALSMPFAFNVQQNEHEPPLHVIHHCSASIGVSVFTGLESRCEDALKWADLAMYQAKENGRDRVQFSSNA